LKRIKISLQDEQGQDVIEYALLLAFLVLASAGLFFGNGGSLRGIWGTADSELAVANSGGSANSATNTSDPRGGGHGGGGHGGGTHGGGGHGGGGEPRHGF
jgi:Flp pilus assembly pilin Flp